MGASVWRVGLIGTCWPMYIRFIKEASPETDKRKSERGFLLRILIPFQHWYRRTSTAHNSIVSHVKR